MDAGLCGKCGTADIRRLMVRCTVKQLVKPVRNPAEISQFVCRNSGFIFFGIGRFQGQCRNDADKIGMLGFSAGAMTTLALIQSEAEDRPHPDFVGYIYGPMGTANLPARLPPLFAALAADDGLFAGQGFGLVEDWQANGAAVELHYYQSGGHGFGSYQRGVTADAWFEQFLGWMEAQDLLVPTTHQDE